MKRGNFFVIFLILVIISSFMISCGPSARGTGTDPEPQNPAETNSPPSTPTYICPKNGSSVEEDVTFFKWNRSSDDGAYVVYNLYVSENPDQLTTPLYSRISGNFKYIGGLSNNTTYYWKVEAVDDLGKTTSGDVWTLFIER